MCMCVIRGSWGGGGVEGNEGEAIYRRESEMRKERASEGMRGNGGGGREKENGGERERRKTDLID